MIETPADYRSFVFYIIDQKRFLIASQKAYRILLGLFASLGR
jgi:hypothetical protein